MKKKRSERAIYRTKKIKIASKYLKEKELECLKMYNIPGEEWGKGLGVWKTGTRRMFEMRRKEMKE